MWGSLVCAFAFVMQDPPPAPIEQDLVGALAGVVAGETVRVTIWQYDMCRNSAEPIADGRADASGKFAFKAVPWVRGHDWGFQSMLVVARAADRAIGLLELRGDALDCTKLVVPLRPAAMFRGTVRAANGKPLADVSIEPWMFEFGEQRLLVGPNLTWRAQTDAQGQFVVRGVPEGARLSLYANHPDCAQAVRYKVDPRERLEIELQPGGVIAGRLRLPDGSPAVRAIVSVQGHAGTPFFTQVRTDDAGNYRVPSLPEGLFNVWAESDDYTVVALHAVRVDAGGTVKDQDLAFVRGGWIVGRVIDEATGKPVQPGDTADVGMSGPARPPETGIQCVPVAADGTFRIRAPAGRNHVYLRAGEGWVALSAGDFDVDEGKETQVEFRAKRGRER